MKYHLLNLAFFLCASYSNAAVVVLNFNGVYDTQGATIFGQNGAVVPFNYQITYDTSLDTDTDFVASGTSMGAGTTFHDWYAYSKSGITSASLTFGSQTWTAANDLLPVAIPNGFSADLWFDTDISLATPTRALIEFDSAGNFLGFGENTVDLNDNPFILPDSYVINPSDQEALSTSFSIQSSVPEPSRSVLLLLGLLMVQSRRKRVTV
jgi:hypothetical protein